MHQPDPYRPAGCVNVLPLLLAVYPVIHPCPGTDHLFLHHAGVIVQNPKGRLPCGRVFTGAVSDIDLPEIGQEKTLEMPGLILIEKRKPVFPGYLLMHIGHDFRHGITRIQCNHKIQVRPFVVIPLRAGSYLNQCNNPLALPGC